MNNKNKISNVTFKIRECLKCYRPFKFVGFFICPKCTKINDSYNFSKREQKSSRLIGVTIVDE